MANEREIINSKWVDYDKYDRRSWPQVQDGSRMALCEDQNGCIHLSGFYNNDDPEWGAKSIDKDDTKIVRYADVESFIYLAICS